MREARSVIVTVWINDQRNIWEEHEVFVDLRRAIETAVEKWHAEHEDVVDGVPVVKLR